MSFELSQDGYNTHFYELKHDHQLAAVGMLRDTGTDGEVRQHSS